MEDFESVEWSGSDDKDRQRDFVALLNRAIDQFVKPTLWHDRDSGAYFFAKPKDREDLKYAYQSFKSFVPRHVVNRYGKKINDPKKPTYWRHSAFLHRFVRLAGDWFVEVTPTYHFTQDGCKLDVWAGDYLKKIKEIERNAAVMGQFVMWREFLLTHGARATCSSSAIPFCASLLLDSLALDVGVPDELWKSQEDDPGSPLFDWAQTGEARRVKLTHIDEPLLEFGGGLRHLDIRFGLMDYGPFDCRHGGCTKAHQGRNRWKRGDGGGDGAMA